MYVSAPNMRAKALGLSVLSTALVLSACEGDRRGPGGGTVTTGAFSGVYVANPDHGTITRMNVDNRGWSKVAVGAEPTRIAQEGNRVYVTNRAARTVTVLEDVENKLATIGQIQTGAEPFGVVATTDRVYVSASTQNEVVEYDALTFEALRTWSVEGEPRGLALHPDGNVLVGVVGYGGYYFSIDIGSGELVRHELPTSFGFDFETGVEFELTKRITGDPTFDESGDNVAIPVLYVDNTTPIFDPNDDPNGDARRPGGGEGYQNRMNPGVVVVPTEPEGRPIAENGIAVSATSFVVVEENGFTQGRIINAFPVAVALTADADFALVALQGADAVVALDLRDFFDNRPMNTSAGAAEAPGFGVPGPGSSFWFVPNRTITTKAGPVGLAVIDDSRAFVHSLFDNTIERIDLDEVRAAFEPNNGTDVGIGADPAPGGGAIPPPPNGEPQQLVALDALTIEGNILSPAADRGRRLFFSASNRTMAADGAGVSCSTCHFDSRTDGLTWNFFRGPRQTPSLAGNVSLSEPVGWQGDRPTVAEDAMMTSQGLMGGEGMTHDMADDIQAFVNFTRDVDNPWATGDVDQIARGKAIFERSDVACANCHYGPTYTNNQIVPMFELEAAKVRPLNGIAMSAPYFHDGSAATIYDLLVRVKDGSMGNTGMLSEQELRDLERYVLSL